MRINFRTEKHTDWEQRVGHFVPNRYNDVWVVILLDDLLAAHDVDAVRH